MASVIGITGLVTVRALGLRSLSLGAEPLPLPPAGFDYGGWNKACWSAEGAAGRDRGYPPRSFLKKLSFEVSLRR